MESNNLFPTENLFSPKTNTIIVKRFLKMLQSWAWLILLIAVVLGGIGFLYSRNQKPVYTATSKLIVSGYSATGVSNYDTVETGVRLATLYTYMLNSNEIIGKALSLVGGGLRYEDMKNAITIAPVRDSQIVQIDVKYTDPVLAAKIANAIVDVFNDRLKSDYANSTLATRENLQTRINALDQQITSLQNEINQAYRKNQDDRIKFVNDNIAQLEGEINQLTIDISSLQHNVVKIQSKGNAAGQNLVVTATPSVEDLNQIALKTALIDQKKDSLSHFHYEYITLITGGDQTFTTDPNISRLQTYLNQLQGTSLSLKQDLASIQEYDNQRLPSVVQIYRAEVPRIPVPSKTLTFTALGFLIGLLFTTIGIYAIELLSPRINDPELISQKFGLPVRTAQHASKTSGNASMKKLPSEPQMYETCRLLRLEIVKKEGIDSVLLAGPTEKDDSASIAANLAFVMAESGTHTLLMDMDIYQSAIPSMFNRMNARGLGEFLSDSVKSIDEVIGATEFPCLSLLCAGGLSSALINQFAGQKGEALLKRLKEQFEFIIINSSSVLSTADALLLTQYAKSVILVANPKKSKLRDLDQCIKKLSGVNANMIEIILNDRIAKRQNAISGK